MLKYLDNLILYSLTSFITNNENYYNKFKKMKFGINKADRD